MRIEARNRDIADGFCHAPTGETNMTLFLDPDYVQTRLNRCRELADRASDPALKEIHVAHMKHYQRMLDYAGEDCSVPAR